MEPTHTCKAVVLHCIDFRFRKKLIEFLNSKFGDAYDLISVAGGVKDMDFVIEQIRISQKLHNPEVIVLIQHEDCGAYGGSKTFKGLEEEAAFQRQELEKAKILLKQHFPQAQIETYFIRLSGDIS